ncbi:sodium:proton antiporter [Enterobacter cloacae]|uniref:cation:proton antiporter n=1 Tax=Enterobacter cloacae TaxID=550 RepID=UPI002FF918B5
MDVLLLIIIVFSSLLSQWVAWKLRLPAILFLLISGILLGPVSGLIIPDALFGNLLFPFVSLAVAIILFEGALTLRFEEIRGLGNVVRNLVSIGMLSTFGIISVSSWWILGTTPEISALIGAVTVVTGPTVIAPLMRVVRPNAAINQILRWEGIVIDPVGAIFTLLVFEFITLHGKAETFAHLSVTLAVTIGTGCLLGIVTAWSLCHALRKMWIPSYLHNFAVLATVLSVFGLSNYLAEESGLLTVTIMGVWLANSRGLDVSDILAFKEELSAVLLSGLFIILAARVDIDALLTMAGPLLLLLIIVQFIARPACIFLSTINSSLSFREKLLLGWISPRGIVAAAVSSLFAITLASKGYEDAQQLVTVVFAIIIGTVVFQSLTSRFVARILGVQKKVPQLVLIIGANQVARELGHVLVKTGLSVQLADDDRAHYLKARMEGLNVYYGTAWSEHAENYLDLSDLALVISLTPDSHKNELAAYHFGHIIGRQNVIVFNADDDVHDPLSHRFYRHQRQYGKSVSLTKLNDMLGHDYLIKATRLNENFGWLDYLEKNGDVLPLFSHDDTGKIVAVSQESSPTLPCTLVALVRRSGQI